jgi:hypothetical protein
MPQSARRTLPEFILEIGLTVLDRGNGGLAAVRLEWTMTVNPNDRLSDDDMETVGGSSKDTGRKDADGTDAQDADGTDAQDADGTDAQDADGTDAADADESDSDSLDAEDAR